MVRRSALKKIIVCTIISAILFDLMVVFASLTPLAHIETSPPNNFGSKDMWLSLFTLTFLYAVPLFFYVRGFAFFKYVMATFCAIGIVTGLSFSFDSTVTLHLYSMGLAISSVLGSIVNIVWFFLMFSKKSRVHLKVV